MADGDGRITRQPEPGSIDPADERTWRWGWARVLVRNVGPDRAHCRFFDGIGDGSFFERGVRTRNADGGLMLVLDDGPQA